MVVVDSASWVTLGFAYGTLAGGSQTVPRAELAALRFAAQFTAGQMRVLVDASVVTKGFGNAGGRGANEDIWADIDKAVKGRSVTIMKVKSHVDAKQVVEQATPWEHIYLNELADAYAQKGAQMAAITRGTASRIEAADHKATLVINRLLAVGKHLLAALPPPAEAEQKRRKEKKEEKKAKAPQPTEGVHKVEWGRQVRCRVCQATWAKGAWSSEACDPAAAVRKKIDPTHDLRLHRGLLFCRVCGGTTALGGEGGSGVVKKLGVPCVGSTAFGQRVLGCLKRDRLPPGLSQWPQSGGEPCRLWN
jgi:hypothetical protein